MKQEVYLGRTLDIAREGGKTVVRYRGLKAATGKTKKEAMAILKAIPEDKFKESADAADRNIERKERWPGQARRFKALLGIEPPRCYVSHMISGRNVLDPLKLDDLLHVPENESMEDFITRKYGQEATDLCKEMMS